MGTPSIDVEHRARVPVVDEDRVLGRLEDRAVTGLGALQRLSARPRSISAAMRPRRS